jgi:hypothetical protein
MSRDDPTDGAIRQGEPPSRPIPGPDPVSTERLALSEGAHSVMIVLVWLLRVVAVLTSVWAGLIAFVACTFRFDSSDELKMVKQADVDCGGLFALAVVLFFVPGRIKKPLQCVIILGAAALLWLFVSWNLLAHHEWVHRVRSGF